MSQLGQRVKQLLQFLCLLRVEVFMFLMTLSSNIRQTPLDLLIQDKICHNKYNLSEVFCYDLPKIAANDTNKNKILSEAVQYNMYQSIIQNAPGIILALFLGAWIDKYNKGRKAVFIVSAFTQCLEAVINFLNAYYFDSDVRWVLVSFVPYILSGSMTWSTSYSYVAATTPAHLRTIRMMVFETTAAFAHLIANLSYGQLINQSPLWSKDQIHNHTIIFLISALSAFLAFIWSLIVINQEKDKQLFEQHFGDNHQISGGEEDEEKEKYNKPMSNRQAFSLLFDWHNIKEIFITCFKRRVNYGRTIIWLIIVGIFCYLYVLISVPSFEFQFYEKVYHWDAQDFSGWESVGLVANAVFVLTFTPILDKVFKLEDMFLTVIGFTGLMLRMIVLASILSPTGYYISLAFSCTTWMANVGFRSLLSKIVLSTELGKVFTLLTVVDGIVPPIASSVTSAIFKQFIDTIPGMVFIELTFVCIFAIIIALIINRLNHKRSDPDISESNTENTEFNT